MGGKDMGSIKHLYTPERITSLQPGEIFVFGSNLQGRHGGGAARMAYRKFGAIWGRGVGLQGQSYAIPTMQGDEETIRPYVDEFVVFAKAHKELTFLVTPIGCGIAGFKVEDIAPLFKEAIVEDNIVLPESFEEVIMRIRPLSKKAIDVLARHRQAQNPYPIGTFSHGIWEHQCCFELLWDSYDYFDWQKYFTERGQQEYFEKGVVLADGLRRMPVNKDWMFRMYMSAEFPGFKSDGSAFDYTNVTECLRKEDLYEIPTPDYLFFWEHNGKSVKACLSQWYPCKFTVDGVVYNCAEQFMMAEKARIMGDDETRAEILTLSDPQKIKALGRRIKNFDEDKWIKHRMDVVITGNFHKFMEDAELKAFLLGTGNKILVEASPYDTIWGIGMKEDHPDSRNPRLWKGKNLLGFALMNVRNKLKSME